MNGIILGLGSNVGNRLSHLRQALSAIKKIPTLKLLQVSPVYQSEALLIEQAPAHWHQPFLNAAILVETQLTPNALLHHCQQIEIKLGRKKEGKWSPRSIDIDILAWHDLVLLNEHLQIPHKELTQRPFALWPLKDIAPLWIHPIEKKTAQTIATQWGSCFSGEAPFRTQQIPQRIDTSQLVGILNITPDSFSDGGHYVEVEKAVQQAAHLVQTGAEIIDIGAESTRPQATLLDAETEWGRLEPVLTMLLAKRSDFLITPKVSIDTRHSDTAKRALDLGVDWINDVSGLSHPDMCEMLAKETCDVVMMHHLGLPADLKHTLPENEDILSTISRWIEKQMLHLEKYGLASERVILDVGIGFGKTAVQSFLLLKHIRLFLNAGIRIMVGHSRKHFLTLFTDQLAKERDLETLVFSLYLAQQGIDFLRVHNTDIHARAFKIAASLPLLICPSTV